VAGRDQVDRAYADITTPDAPRYLWHEFGDSMLLLP
jgi:S-adenosylmethionine:tRNA ribosyltransferase-isomerase